MGTDPDETTNGRTDAGTPTTTPRTTIPVEIWSDVVCPWCYIGKRRFEAAVAELADEFDVEIVYRPFQLDPRAAPGASEPVADAYARKFGGPEQARAIMARVTDEAARDGLGFRLDRARRANTLLAHRALWWAEQPGSPIDQATLKERLLQAYFVDGLHIGDPEVVADCCAELGADRDTVAELLAGDAGRAEVVAMLEQAWELGITAVPTFVIGGQWTVPGAQETGTFVRVLRKLGAALTPEPTSGPASPAAPDGGVCTDDACDV